LQIKRTPVALVLAALTIFSPAHAAAGSFVNAAGDDTTRCNAIFSPIVEKNYSFSVSAPEFTPSAALLEQLDASAKAIYDTWAALLGENPLFSVDNKLLLLANRNDFRTLQHKLAPKLPSVSGFYAGSTQQAVVLFDAREPERTRKTALHEISHHMTTSQLGAAPPWLQEGLAEYFEMIALTEQGAVVEANVRHSRYLREGKLSLEDLLGSSMDAWKTADSHRNYAAAWALVFFLMESTQGRAAFGRTLREASAYSCRRYDVAAHLGSAYPGGLERLRQDWQRWLLEGEFSPQRLPLHLQ
jgi:hypothetical protein